MIKKVLAALALSFALGGTAQAATQQSNGNCSINDVTGAVECVGPIAGNAQQFDPSGLFGVSNWSVIQTAPNYGGGPTGSFDVTSHNYDVVAVLLKSGNEFAAYRLSDWFGGTLSFATANGKGLSNFVILGSAAVPVPAAGFLLLAGLGGLALMRRRKATV